MKKFYEKAKPLLSILLLCVIFSFMLVIFEPISLYANNTNDFWFDLYDMLPELLPAFVILAVGSFLIFGLIYFISFKLFKKPAIFYILSLLFFAFFIITYIQGNFLSGSLPGLNGNPFNWREYKVETAISIILWAVVFIALFIAIKKLSSKKVFTIIPAITLVVFAMLFVSLITTLETTRDLEDKNTSKATLDYYNHFSNQQNFFIFLVDAIDSRSFDALLKDSSDYQKTFKDFSYYQDTLSYYPYTRDSIPQIFYSTPNENETEFDDYSRKAFSESPIINSLASEKYNMYFYDDQVIMSADTAELFKNMSNATRINSSNFLYEIFRYDLFKYLPFPLKGKAHIENSNFWTADLEEGHNEFVWGDRVNYNIYKNEPLEIVDDKVFHFIHLEGAHIWFNLDEDLNPIDKTKGTYSQKQAATMKVIKAYIDRLKKADVYDKSSIVIMSDHGYMDGVWEYDYILNRFNPSLYIKGVNEHHNQMVRSDKPISFADLSDAFEQLRLGAKSTELFQNINSPRTRTLIYYIWNQENHMVEYTTEGKAWDDTSMVETGRIFDR